MILSFKQKDIMRSFRRLSGHSLEAATVRGIEGGESGRAIIDLTEREGPEVSLQSIDSDLLAAALLPVKLPIWEPVSSAQSSG